MSANTDPQAAIATLRSDAEAVRERHHQNRVQFVFNGNRYQDGCVGCAKLNDGKHVDWPCDAFEQATRVLELLDAVEDARRHFDTVYQECKHHGMVSDIGINATYGIDQIDEKLLALTAALNGAADG